MVSTLYKIRRKGYRVSRSGILFKQVKGPKGKPAGEKLIALEKKHGAKNIEVIRKKSGLKFFRRVGKV